MNINEATTQFQEFKKNIDEKYGKIMEEIAEIDKKINDLNNNLENNSKQYIEDKKTELNAKLEKKKEAAQKWLNEQTEKIQKWLDDVKDQIQKQLEQKVQIYLDSLK